MSVYVSSWVWEHSNATGNARLVLLAIADCADDSGANAWPSLQSIARKAKVSRRTAIRAISELVDMGELECTRGAGQRGAGGVTNRYRVTMVPAPTGDTVSPPSGDTDGTRDNLALVTNQTEVVTPQVKGGDTGGTRTSLTSLEPTTRRRPATPVPADFTVTDAMAEWAEAQGIQRWAIPLETEQFLDWHRSKDSRNRDWAATWRTWMRKAKGFRPEITRPDTATANLGPNTSVC